MRKYKIYHNPFTNETKLFEYYEGDSIPWGNIGGEDAPALKELLNKRIPIQSKALDLFTEIYSHNKQKSDDQDFVLSYDGDAHDFEDLLIVKDKFSSTTDEKQSHFTKIEKGDVFDSPIDIANALEKKFQDVCDLYSESENTTILKEIQDCKKIEDTDLTVLVFGQQNSGKSTLINALIGMELLPASDDIETATICEIKKGEKYHITILLSNDEEIDVNVTDKNKYHSDTEWIRRLLGSVYDDEALTTPEKKTAEIIKRINTQAKMMQQENEQTSIVKLIVEIPSFSLGDNVHIVDCPGADAKYLNEKHKQLIEEAIRSSTHAVSLYVMRYSNRNLNANDQIRNDFMKIDLNRDNSGTGQIDFERSIYVFSCADGGVKPDLEDWVKRNPEYHEKRIVPVSALTALELITLGIDKITFPWNFTNVGDDRELFLERAAIYPSSYDKNKIWKDYLEKLGNTKEAIIRLRTGVPIVQYFIKDYADNFASIYRVDCYNKAFNDVLRVLENEQIQKEKQLVEKKEKKENQLKTIRNNLKESLETGWKEQKNNLSNDGSSSIRSSITHELENNLSDIMKVIPDWFKESDAEFLRMTGKKPKKEQLVEDIQKRIQAKVEEDSKEFCRVAAKTVNEQFDMYVQSIKETISNGKPEEVNADEIESLLQMINELHNRFNITPDDFSIKPEDFRLKNAKNPGELVEAILNPKKYKIRKTKELFGAYWSDKVVESVLNESLIKLEDKCSRLTEDVKREIDKFAPELKKVQTEVAQREMALNAFRKKIKKTKEIKEEAKRIIEEGHVNVR